MISLYRQVPTIVDGTIVYGDDPSGALNPVFLDSAGNMRPMQYADGSLVMLETARPAESSVSQGSGQGTGQTGDTSVSSLAQTIGAAVDASSSGPKVEKWSCKPQDYYTWRNLFENRLSRKKILPVPLKDRIAAINF